jgi:hypothetical protein
VSVRMFVHSSRGTFLAEITCYQQHCTITDCACMLVSQHTYMCLCVCLSIFSDFVQREAALSAEITCATGSTLQLLIFHACWFFLAGHERYANFAAARGSYAEEPLHEKFAKENEMPMSSSLQSTLVSTSVCITTLALCVYTYIYMYVCVCVYMKHSLRKM